MACGVRGPCARVLGRGGSQLFVVVWKGKEGSVPGRVTEEGSGRR